MINGPQGLGGNHPRNIEYSVEWVTSLLEHMRSENLERVEPSISAVKSWSEHIRAKSESALANNIDSWMTGINTNVPGKDKRAIGFSYGGSVQSYRTDWDSVAGGGDNGMDFC